MELDEVQRRLDASGGRWTAGPSAVALRQSTGQTDMFGLDATEDDRLEMVRTADNMEMDLGSLADDLQLPPRWDWREHAVLTGVRSQGTCMSCVAFAVCAALEARIKIDQLAPEPPDLSEAHMFHCGRPHGCRDWMAPG